MLWYTAMLALMPLMALPFAWGAQGDVRKVRVWLVMYAASLATFISGHPVWFLAIDAVAAAIILRQPRGAGQRLIGGIFLIMVCMNGGFYCAELIGGLPSYESYIDTMRHWGWAQWLVLLVWCSYDFLGHFGFVRCWHLDDGNRENALARSDEQ